MNFSKSFGYAIRSILFIAYSHDPSAFLKADEIALKLKIPRHFLSKVLKALSKKGILTSSKGPKGGFGLQKDTLSLSLRQIAEVTHDLPDFSASPFHLTDCPQKTPCPLHQKLHEINSELIQLLDTTTLQDLMNKEMWQVVSVTENRNSVFSPVLSDLAIIN